MFDNISSSKPTVFLKFISTFVVIIILFLVTSEAKSKARIDPILVVEFAIKDEKSKFLFMRGGNKEKKEFFEIVREISMNVLMEELEKTPSLRPLFVPLKDLRSVTIEDYAEKKGINYFVTGEIAAIKDNALIRAKWVNKRDKARGEVPLVLGEEKLQDFDIVVSEIKVFSQTIIRRLLTEKRPSAGRLLQPKILIACFTGGIEAGNDILDRYLTLELPYSLEHSLMRLGINTERFQIKGLLLSEFYRACLEKNLTEEYVGDIRYIISGNIISVRNDILVKPLLFDRYWKTLIPIQVDLIISNNEIETLPQQLADQLAAPLVITIVQGLLAEEGFDTGFEDGFLGPMTQEALRRYQAKHDLPATGSLDTQTLQCLGLQ